MTLRTPLRGLAAIAALAAGAALATPLSAQTIRGTLMDVNTDRPINLGLVMMFTETGDSVTSTITNEAGFFSITAPEPGGYLLLAAALGYKETPAGVFELGADGEMTVEYRVAPEPLPIDELVVSLDRPILEHRLVRNGFVRRYQQSQGHFITPYDIENTPAMATEDLFQGIPDVVVRPNPGQLSYVGDVVQIRDRGGGGWCTPLVFVDGVRVQYSPTEGLSLSTLVPLQAIEAAEVYRGATEVPPQYNITTGGDLCGVLILWTRTR